MGKRFADTALSREAWFRKLEPAFKCAWRFLCDECDCAGVWSIDEEAMAFQVFGKQGRSIDLRAFVDAVNSDGKVRIKRVGRGKLLLAGFIRFQYGALSEACKPHKRVIDRLKELGLFEQYSKGMQTLEEEEEEEDREKEEEEEGGVGGKKPATVRLNFDAFWRAYPRKIAKAVAKDRFKKLIEGQADLDSLLVSVGRFRAHHEAKGTEAQYIPHPASFLGTKEVQSWRDWLDEENGTSDIVAANEFVGLKLADVSP